ncbi:hypothetical protein, partial [Sutterella wadsworthensis]|uniref:hypothetical protein n=1 Tax=Sutterella wadsworthensis TaxID=40545 RepID=UPI0024310EC8
MKKSSVKEIGAVQKRPGAAKSAAIFAHDARIETAWCRPFGLPPAGIRSGLSIFLLISKLPAEFAQTCIDL